MFQIDNDLLNQKLREFIAFVNTKSGMIFSDFVSNPYIYQNENYKTELRLFAFNELSFLSWNKNSFGTGKILNAVIKSIEQKQNNLVIWQNRYGPNTKDHHRLIVLRDNKDKLYIFERNTFDFFHNKIDDASYFDYLIQEAGKKYALLAYIFFIKNPQKYLPISTSNFDKLFKDLNIDFSTTHKCSWENYHEYLTIIKTIQVFLQENLSCEISFLDTHSFCWILTSQMRSEMNVEYLSNYNLYVPKKNRETIIKARIGQGLYRTALLNKWNNSSSISDYSNSQFLIASHIKPWKDCTNKEAIDPDNGLLLSPNYDFLFDRGYISFSENGSIIVSNELTYTDFMEFFIDTKVKIKELNDKTRHYLLYHVTNVFRK